MSATEIIIDETIAPYLEAAAQEGFRVFVLKPDEVRPDAAQFAYVALDVDGSFATINVASLRIEPVFLSVPIAPSRKFGSSVGLEYDGTVLGALRSLRSACESRTVAVRYMGLPAPVVPNYGFKSITKWPTGGVDRFVELTTNVASPLVATA